MIMRGTTRKIATLKRIPTDAEYTKFNISMYPKTWSNLRDTMSIAPMHNNLLFENKTLKDSFKSLGFTGRYITERIFTQRESSHFCGSRYLGDHHKAMTIEKETSDFLSKGISLVALSYRTPMSLVNSMRTWNSSGLLSVVAERLAILSDPTPAEYYASIEHGFRVLQPKDMKLAKSKQSKPNVLTIGAAFYFALQYIQNEYLLFLESDFKMDTGLTLSEIQLQLLAAAGMLERGAEVVRLLSRKDQGCGTFKVNILYLLVFTRFDSLHAGVQWVGLQPSWHSSRCRQSRTKNTQLVRLLLQGSSQHGQLGSGLLPCPGLQMLFQLGL